jgi:putative restriction endonuclease
MGITPDYLIKVNEKVLDEKDGPMLQHGIKELNDTKMIIPTRIEWRPNRDNLSKRFEEFNKIV